MLIVNAGVDHDHRSLASKHYGLTLSDSTQDKLNRLNLNAMDPGIIIRSTSTRLDSILKPGSLDNGDEGSPVMQGLVISGQGLDNKR